MSDLLPSLEQLRLRHSSKWRRYNSDVLPMHVAEMNYEIAPSIKALLIEFIQNSDIGYLGPVPEVAQAFAGFAKRRWGWQPDPSQIRISTDVGVSAIALLQTLGKPGDRVLINSPVYSSFYSWIQDAGQVVVDVPLIQGDETWHLDLAGIEQAFAEGVSFYLMCSPHNPIGAVFGAAELAAIAELAVKHGVTVISDEIHAPLTYADQTFTPWLNVSEAARKTGVVISAASKSFNLAGLKASIIVTQDSDMWRRVSAVNPALHWRSGILGAFGMAEAFENCDSWLDQAVEANRASRDYLIQQIDLKLPGVKTWLPKGGYLAWVDVSTLKISENPALTIIDERKVAFVPGVDHGSAYPQYVRINFAASQADIDASVDALASYLHA
jgi:cysteine-S-conjugate beta-lyase